MDDLIRRADAIRETWKEPTYSDPLNVLTEMRDRLEALPSAEPTLYGYNIEHLKLIARALQKENLPPDRLVEILTDIGRIVAMVKDEFEEALRKAVEQCTI